MDGQFCSNCAHADFSLNFATMGSSKTIFGCGHDRYRRCTLNDTCQNWKQRHCKDGNK